MEMSKKSVEQVLFDILKMVNKEFFNEAKDPKVIGRESVKRMEYGDVHFSMMRNYNCGVGIYTFSGTIDIGEGLMLYYIFTNRRTHLAISGVKSDERRRLAESYISELVRKYHIDMIVNGLVGM